MAIQKTILRTALNLFLLFLPKFFPMPKMKTNSSAKKRFKLTGSGKVKRNHAFHSHILTKKTTKQKKRLVKSTLVSKVDTPKIKRLLVKA